MGPPLTARPLFFLQADKKAKAAAAAVTEVKVSIYASSEVALQLHFGVMSLFLT